MGSYMHPCKEQMVCKAIQKQQVPKFNRRLFLQNKTEVGTVDEILGPVDSFVRQIPFPITYLYIFQVVFSQFSTRSSNGFL